MLSSSKQISTERPLTDSEITKPAARKMKTTTCPQTNRCSPPVGFFGNKAEKLYIFAKKAERGGSEETVCLIRQPARAFRSGHPRSGQIIIGCRGGSGAAGSVPDPARSGLWMQIKLFPFFSSNAWWRKPIPKSCSVARTELSDLMLQSG